MNGQVELKDIRTGTKYHERLRASESVERVRLDDEEEYDYLYRCGVNAMRGSIDGSILRFSTGQVYDMSVHPLFIHVRSHKSARGTRWC